MASTPPPNAANFDPFDDPVPAAPPPTYEYFTRPPLVIPDRDIDIAKICGPRPLADTRAAGVNWLWPGRVPLGKLTLLVGDPGVGKSLLALDIAARTTTAHPWPDAPSPPSPLRLPPSPLPASALILSAEDDPADTIRPRLVAMGADLNRVVANPWPRLVDDHPERPHPLGTEGLAPAFDLGRDLGRLAMLLDVMPACRLIILDPLAAFLGRHIENTSAEVRRVLSPLAGLASRRNLAILAICHLRRAPGTDLVRSAANHACMAFARLGWLVACDPADEERRILAPVKNNLGPLGPALPFNLVSRHLGAPPQVVWEATPLATSVSDTLRFRRPRASPELDDAKRWLKHELAGGVVRSRTIEDRAAAHGFRPTTLRRAFRELAGEAVRTQFGSLGVWHWRLPGVGRQDPDPDALPFDMS